MKAEPSKIRGTGRGSYAQQARLWSGFILLLYVTGHFINHGLGLVSLNAMEQMREVMSFIWGSLPGSVALYVALGVHILLGLWTVINIRSLKQPIWRWIQIGLGLAIPYWLIGHIIATRGTEIIQNTDVVYLQELALLWPAAAIKQNALLLIVWFHGMIGLHFWSRLNEWYRSFFGFFLFAMFTVPFFAITGWITAAQRELMLVELDRTGQKQFEVDSLVANANAVTSEYVPAAQMAVLALLGATLCVFLVLYFSRNFRKRVTVTYGPGLKVEAAPGSTVLDVSRQANIPHMSICGGRARCSTCRIMVVSDPSTLKPPGQAERRLLESIGADANMRLACQAKIVSDAEVRPIIQPGSNEVAPIKSDPYAWGVERKVAIMFLNIHGFAKIVDSSLPYDVVFILNEFFDQMTAEIEGQGGYVDKFMGDGLMAIFGLETNAREASIAALTAGARCHQAAQELRGNLSQYFDEPLSIGVGVHVGDAIVGRVGKTSDQVDQSRVTAIGHSVNIASRLERISKKADSGVVYSRDVHEVIGLGKAEMLGKPLRVQVKNLAEPISIVIVNNSRALLAAIMKARKGVKATVPG